ncbi:hypothetical protein [Micromonospora sp. WMMD1155]|uniref:hypothetical protein n=1 Tax=Micromonospora sp. WMMD1155 TaxID=3016094 RepID=UPI00249A2BED|nr:hypothetical protein [Micromonospora sp. WMMD1155]WFE55327.1 hypothetical protein O7617_03480 [Micromonospora sp. WMMD1155]
MHDPGEREDEHEIEEQFQKSRLLRTLAPAQRIDHSVRRHCFARFVALSLKQSYHLAAPRTDKTDT